MFQLGDISLHLHNFIRVKNLMFILQSLHVWFNVRKLFVGLFYSLLLSNLTCQNYLQQQETIFISFTRLWKRGLVPVIHVT